jgi:glycosyltransferase involved in cell wall biosynthesis
LDFESKIIRGEAAFNEALLMRDAGFYPDIIVAHPGWGESLFLKDVWPKALLGLYCEYYYQPNTNEMNFDPEFTKEDVSEAPRLRIKNINNDLHFRAASSALSPTQFQRSTFPDNFRKKINVIHDGIDTDLLVPNPKANIRLNNNIVLDRSCELITFVNRNLEPLRGYHIFMRALPDILRKRPNAHVVIVGGDSVSYGAPPKEGSWRNIFLDEVRDQLDMRRVHFVGKLSYPSFIQLLQTSRVHVYLTYPFVLSWSLLEAMSMGCAILASNTEPVREVITHNETGLLVDFFDKEGLVESLCSLLDDKEKRKQLGDTARKFVVENYDLKKICLPKQTEWIEQLYSKEN